MSSAAREKQPTVVIIEDDPDVREALEGLLQSVDLSVRPFRSVQQYVDAAMVDEPGCIIMDVRLPGRSGLDFQQDLVRQNIRRSIVFLSGHADVAMSVRAMKAGAVEFLTKPVRNQDLLDAVQVAIERDRAERALDAEEKRMQANHATLTVRERDVMVHVVAGLRNKQIAAALGLSEATVKLHRGNVMKKMQARTLADLIRMGDRILASGCLP